MLKIDQRRAGRPPGGVQPQQLDAQEQLKKEREAELAAAELLRELEEEEAAAGAAEGKKGKAKKKKTTNLSTASVATSDSCLGCGACLLAGLL
jgi:hypothetical protein